MNEKMKFYLFGMLVATLIVILAQLALPRHKTQEEIEYDLDLQFQVVRTEIQKTKDTTDELIFQMCMCGATDMLSCSCDH